MFIRYVILVQSGPMKKRLLPAVIAALMMAIPPAILECGAFSGGASGEGGRPGGRESAPVVINEFLPAPRTAFSEEWVELFNPGVALVDLGGWALDDSAGGGSKPFVIPNGTLIGAGGFLVLYNSTTQLALNNDGDTVRLLDPSGTVTDTYSYDSSRYDTSFGRFPDGGPAWRSFTAPTPGATNGARAPAGPADGSVILTRVYYHAFSGKWDEHVAVTNPDGSSRVDLSGWTVSAGASGVVFPDGATLAPGATVYVTGNASDFLWDCGFLPDFETQSSRPAVGQARPTGNWPAMGNESGHVSLQNANGEPVDVFAWGRPFNGTGWSGPASEAILAGEVAIRLRDAHGWADTNSSADWPAANATVIGRSDFGAETFDADSVTTFVSPDCSYQAIAQELDAARASILLAVYQFESWPLAQKLVAARHRGVAVSVLLEGAPVEGISDQERAVARLLAEAGASVSFLAARPGTGVPDRYYYIHAKYCVIDDSTCVVSSENWKATGIPSDESFGNRGWGAVVQSAGLAAYLTAVYRSDSNPPMRDVIPYSPEGGTFGPPPSGFVPDTAAPAGSYRPLFSTADIAPPIRVRPVLSPDTSSAGNFSVLGLIGSAARTLDIEQLSCPAEWGSGASRRTNPYLEALVEAARRGVRVRLLLDGTYLDPADSQEENADALNYLNHAAAAEGLDLQARFAKIPGALKLHNKGVVADGERALVSSINWGPTSVFDNREVGLILESPAAAGYFERAFEYDWNSSARVPNPGGNGTGGPGDTAQATLVRALVLSVVLVAAAVVVILRRAGSGRRRW
jgi:cardiolipin synthase